MNEASASDGIPTELFQNLKEDAVKVVHSICQKIWKTKQWPQDWKRSVFIPTPKKGNAKECSNYCKIALISHAKKAMLKFSKPGFNDTRSQSQTWLSDWTELNWSIVPAVAVEWCSVQFSCSVVFDSLWLHGLLQHARLSCASPTPRACSNSRPLHQWCQPTITSSVVAFSSCLQFFPASGSFLRSQFFASGGQSIGVSVSASVLPMNIQYWFPLWLTGLISLQSKGLSRVFSKTTVQKHQLFGAQLSLWSNSHIYTWLLENT